MSTSTSEKKSLMYWIMRYVPILHWLPKYQFSWLRADVISGLTVWAVMVPESMAYAGIAGVPPLVGLYTVPIPLIAYAIFGTSRTMVIGPDSATALISAGTVGAVIATHSGATQVAEYVMITSALALIVGVIFLIVGIARMGWVANFIPSPVMQGFIQGLVWVTIIGQVPKLFGIEGAHGNFFEQLWAIFPKLADANLVTTAIGLGSLALLFIFARYVPKLPAALTTVILAIILVSVFGLSSYGVDIVGSVKAGLPTLAIPQFTLAQLELLIPGAFAIVMLGYAESLGAAKAASTKSGGSVDPNQELIAHGPANIGSALSGGFVVVGSLSKTSVSMGAGGKTQMASLVHAGFIILTLMFLLPLFTNLAHAALAAIVIHAMIGLFKPGFLIDLWKRSRLEFTVAAAAYLGVMAIGVLAGIGLGVVLALLLLIYHATVPPTAELGRLPNGEGFRSLNQHPDLETIKGLLIYRFSAGLFYANANYFVSSLKKKISESNDEIHSVLVDASTINLIDSTSIEKLVELEDSLKKEDISLYFSHVNDRVKETMTKEGFVDKLGEDHFFEILPDGIANYQNSIKANNHA